MNLPYEGGGFRFAPEASVTDGCIDIVIAHHMSPLKAVWLLPRAFFGKHTGAKEITIIRSPSVSVEAQRSLPIHTDGEAAFSRYKASVEILEEKIAYHCRITAGKFNKCFLNVLLKKVVVHFKSCYNRCNRKD